MARYLIGRLAQFALVVGTTLLAVFVALHAVTDPARTTLPIGTPQSEIDLFNERYGFDDPLLVQSWRFLGNAVTFDFGESLTLRRGAFGAVLERLPATLMLVGTATLFGATMGVLLGVIAARRPDSIFDRLTNVASFVATSIAEFWLGLMAILLFAVYLKALPSGGYNPKPEVLVLPALVLSMRPFGRLAQLTRASMLAEYDKQYVMTARAKGVSESRVSRRHVLRNAAIPIMTLGFYELARVFVGSAVIVEVLFGWPGMGRLVVDALGDGDIFLVQAGVAIAAIAAASINLVADLLYFTLDPRTRSLVERATDEKRVLRALRQDPMMVGVLTVWLGLMLFAILYPSIVSSEAGEQRLLLRFQPPAWDGGTGGLIGTDELGRDLLLRIAHGLRTSFVVGLLAVTLGGTIGATIGLLAGYLGGRWDTVLMRITDIVQSFPGLLLAMVVVAASGRGRVSIVLVLGLLSWVVFARVVRATVLTMRTGDLIASSIGLGAGSARVITRHVLPHVLPALVTVATLEFAVLMLAESALSFLGFGVQHPQVSLGSILAGGRDYVQSQWWIATFAGICLTLAVLSTNLIASWLQRVTKPIGLSGHGRRVVR